MSEQDHHSEDAVNAALKAKSREDFDDLQKELSGLNVKDNRFLRDDDPRNAQGRARREREETATRLSLFLSDPGYQALYNETMTALGDAESAVYDAIVDASDAVKDAQDALDAARENGASEAELEALQKKLDEAKERHERMLERERELAEIRRRMEDPDNPPSKDEMDGYRKRIGEIENEAKQCKIAKQSLDASEPETEKAPNANFSLDGYSPS